MLVEKPSFVGGAAALAGAVGASAEAGDEAATAEAVRARAQAQIAAPVLDLSCRPAFMIPPGVQELARLVAGADGASSPW